MYPHHKDLIIWRKSIQLDTQDKEAPGDLFEYKVLGRVQDLTPLEFFQTQIDLEYRKVWDNLVLSLDVIDHDQTSHTDLVYWTMRFPYPLYPREYILAR